MPWPWSFVRCLVVVVVVVVVDVVDRGTGQKRTPAGFVFPWNSSKLQGVALELPASKGADQ